MFSKGQWIFAALFLISFIITAIFVYRKDAALHKQYYKGSFKVLIGFIFFLVLLFVIKVNFKR